MVSLRDLLIAEPATPILASARRPPLAVHVGDSREDVARLISKYDLLAVPVVDEAGHVLGIVTVDDVIDAIIAESDRGRPEVRRHGGARRALHADRLRRA